MSSSQNPEVIGIRVDVTSVELVTFQGYAEADGYEDAFVVAYLDVEGHPAAIDWIAECWIEDPSTKLQAHAEMWTPLSKTDATECLAPAVQLLVRCHRTRGSSPQKALMLVVPLMRQHLLVAWAGLHGSFTLCVDVAEYPILQSLYRRTDDNGSRGRMLLPVEVDRSDVLSAELNAWRAAFADTSEGDH